jgi:molybdopterin molybdotransferase
MTFQLVKLTEDGKAEPVFTKSGMISPMSEADGYMILEENKEGLRAGETARVFLWR